MGTGILGEVVVVRGGGGGGCLLVGPWQGTFSPPCSIPGDRKIPYPLPKRH